MRQMQMTKMTNDSESARAAAQEREACAAILDRFAALWLRHWQRAEDAGHADEAARIAVLVLQEAADTIRGHVLRSDGSTRSSGVPITLLV